MRARHGERFVLPRWVRRMVYAVGTACAASGTAWLLLHTFVQVESEFGPQPHPLEHPLLVVHGVAAALVLWTFGLLWLSHVRRAWSRHVNRLSGGTMVALLAWLGASGLGLYYLADERWRDFASIGHWALGLFAVLWLPVHIWRGRRRVHARERAAGGR